MKKKQFNTYKEELDLEFLWNYCMEHGEERTLERGEMLEETGKPAQWVAYVEQGYFKYMVHNEEEEKDYCTGFAFEGEFVANFPHCLRGETSELDIVAATTCRIRCIAGLEMQSLFDSSPEMMLHNVNILHNLFKMVYTRYLDFYRYSARERYRQLMLRFPHIMQQVSQKDLATLLNITPTHLSRIRTELTLGYKGTGGVDELMFLNPEQFL